MKGYRLFVFKCRRKVPEEFEVTKFSLELWLANKSIYPMVNGYQDTDGISKPGFCFGNGWDGGCDKINDGDYLVKLPNNDRPTGDWVAINSDEFEEKYEITGWAHY